MRGMDATRALAVGSGMSEELALFRAQLREWLEENCPPTLRVPGSEVRIAWGGGNRAGQSADALHWMEAMASRGFIAARWPRHYGGAQLSDAQAAVLGEEMRRIAAPPPIVSFGLWMLAPILFEFGSEEQRRRFLPPIARGEMRWCQGYSEPGAGSDLAALQTRCEDAGEHWLINGQKIWTSDAHLSDWMFCLVRTDRSVKQSGISFILMDMNSPGVERRPIKLISGASPFCETFFSDVRVPKDQMVGPVNGGWQIAKRLLQYERQTISDAGSARQEPLHEAVAHRGAVLDHELRDRIARVEMREQALELTLLRARQEGVSHLASALKVAGSLLRQDRAEVMVDALGLASLLEQPVKPGAAAETSDLGAWLRSRSATMEGGTTEINLNVIAKRILDLPDPKP
jgi:alkylation response protein AidB-like acyl-CoA dehydrogenase